MTDPLVAALTESRHRGFLGPGPVEPRIDHALAFARVVPDPPARSLDLGAGGGLPGLVLATRCWPETRWTFLDARARRTAFLVEAAEELAIADRISVVTGRAEEIGRDAGHRAGYDLVVARSFAAPAVTAECAAPFLAVGGHLVVSEPPAGDPADRWPAGGLAEMGFGSAVPHDVGTETGPVHLVSVRLESTTPDRFPRRVGIPAKRPLF